MNGGHRRKRRGKGALIVATIILGLLLFEAVVLVAVFVSPQASKSVTNMLSDAQVAWDGTDENPGIRERMSSSLNEFYSTQIEPLWSEAKPNPTAPTFAKCVACHEDYMTKVRFNNVYMNHPVHQQEGIKCATCHTNVQHPNPPVPQEKVCAKCHEQVSQDDGCDFCHFPGSLPHFYLLGYPRNSAVDCSTCHPKGAFAEATPQDLVNPGPFLGEQRDECTSCHEVKTSNDYYRPACMDCHGVDHPDDWLRTHGRATGVVYQGQSQCADCHPSAAWCATLCHPGASPEPHYPMPTEVPSP